MWMPWSTSELGMGLKGKTSEEKEKGGARMWVCIGMVNNMNARGVGSSGVEEIEGGGTCLYTKELFWRGRR